MTVDGDDMSTTVPVPRLDPSPVPATRPRGRVAFVLPLLAAAAAGLAAGASPHTTLVVTAAVVAALVLAVRLEWAALAVIGSAVFEDYLDLLSPWAIEWLVLLMVVAWAVRRAQGPLHEHRLLTTTVPAAVFAAVLALAASLDLNGHPGLVVCAKYAELMIVLLVLADALSGPLSPLRAARVYVWSCVLAAVCGIVTALVDEPHRVVGPLAVADDLAFFLIAAVPLLGAVRTRSRQPEWWIWAAFATIVVALAGTRSRGAVAALAVMLVISLAFRMLPRRYAGVLMVLAATTIAFVLAVLPHPVGQAVSDSQRYAETGISERNDLRQAAVMMIRAQPVLGHGPGSFALFHQDYRAEDADPADLDLDTAYSSALEVAAELGVLGALALFGLFVVPGVAALRHWRRARSDLTAATLLALTGLLAAALIESQQYRLPLWFIAAMATALGHTARRRIPCSDDSSSGQVLTRK
jgi:putative inorganic carbon (hco3(-)) transporter